MKALSKTLESPSKGQVSSGLIGGPVIVIGSNRKQMTTTSGNIGACRLALVLVMLAARCVSAALVVLPQQQQQQQQWQLRPALPSAQRSAFLLQQQQRANELSSSGATNTSSHGQQADIETSALNYLQRYGYMSPNQEASNNLISEESFSSAIEDFQRFAGLPATGLADKQTLELMQLPRCGNSDKWGPLAPSVRKSGQLRSRRQQLSRKRRYALQGSKWRRQELTYRISQYPSRFQGKRHEVDEQIAKAFGIWSHVAPIDFVVKREGRVHIDIRFASGDHGDGDAFDGPGNTLAHAYFPQYGGDAHFDDQEYWTIDSYAGTNIFQVAAHELGHSLGLGHSNVREALMAPFYQKYKPNFRLHVDDILAIQALYGEKAYSDPFASSGPSSHSSSSSTSTTTTTTTSTTTSTVAPPSRRAVGRFPIYTGGRRPADSDGHEESSSSSSSNGGSDDDNELGNPDLSANGMGNSGGAGGESATEATPPARDPHSYQADLCADSSIDAITRTEDGSSYVFKGDHYWLLAQDGLAKGYPRPIGNDWQGLPGNLDAALTWADGKTFFFKGNKYWRFRNKRRDLGYPKLISSGFAGIPDDVDAAFVWSGNGRTYFFKGADYWRFDSKADPPVSGEYPRSTKVWLGVPAHINAAFKWENNVTYFFKGNQYYRFNDRDFKVEARGRPPFPRATAEWWFGCVGSNLAAQRALPANFAESASPTLETQPQPQRRAGSQQPGEPGDWAFLAGLGEESTRSMGTHISDGQAPGAPEPQATVGQAAPPPDDPGEQVITVDGPSGVQANSVRQARQHVDEAKFEDFHWPRPRGGHMGTTLFSSTTASNGSGLTLVGGAPSASGARPSVWGSLFSSAILITCLQQLLLLHAAAAQLSGPRL